MPKSDCLQGSLDLLVLKVLTKETGRRLRTYELTPAGKQQLATEESRWQSVTSAVNRVLRTV